MDDLMNHNTNEEHLSTTFLNNAVEEINEEKNQEGISILDGVFLFNQKDIGLFKFIDKQNKEEKEHKNNINYDKDIFNFEEKLNEKIKISSKIKDLKKEESIKKKRKKNVEEKDKNMKMI
jgi:hypothetical protein